MKAASTLQPADPYLHLYLSMLYLATSRDQQVLEHAKASLPLLVNDPTTAFQMAKACLRADRADEAAAIANELNQAGRFTLDQNRELARLFFENHSYGEAAEQFRVLVATDPASWENKFNLAVALLNSKKADQALTVLEPLAVNRIGDSKVLGLLGSAYETANKIPEALEAYRKETVANPQEPDGYLDYSQLLMSLSRYDEAEQFLTAGLALVREPYPLYMRLGSVQMMASKYDKARELFQKALDEHPEISVGYIALAQLSFKSGQNDQAEKLLEAARQKIKSDFLLEYYYGLSLDRVGRKEEAVISFERAIHLNPGVAEIHFELGRVYFETDRIAPAQTELEKAIQIEPQFAKSYVYLSRIYARLGNSEKAHQLADQARRLKQNEREGAAKAQESRLQSLQPIVSQ